MLFLYWYKFWISSQGAYKIVPFDAREVPWAVLVVCACVYICMYVCACVSGQEGVLWTYEAK